jgi:hypothetical protein
VAHMNKELTLSFLLACAVVTGVLWLIAASDRPVQEPNIPDSAAKAFPHQTHVTNVPEPASASNLPPSAVEQEIRSSAGGIVKCTVNGKTIYSDQKCPDGARTHQVQLHDTAGVISPKKETLAQLTAQRTAAENVRVGSPQPPAAAPSNQAECESLNKHIDWLDSMARQPQSGQKQDWIRQERRKARDRQIAIQC